MKSILFSALFIATIAGASAAINCYSCLDCGDPFNSTGVIDSCEAFPGNMYCAKSVVDGVVNRACIENSCTEGCVGNACIYCCDSELCNGGNTVTTSFVAMGVALVAAFIFSRE